MAVNDNEKYLEFLKSKEMSVVSCGFEPDDTNPVLFKWQNDVVRWACMKGKACLFEECGLGKTGQQLQWARNVVKHTGKPVLILTPLAVAQQTKRESVKFQIDVPVKVCRTGKDVVNGINITNYEMLEHFDASIFSGVVLDESSILKNYSGKTRTLITDMFQKTPYKLCCTATPAPNDYMELGTHAQFMGVMTQSEMLSTFFVHDGGETSKWRLKGHAVGKFFEWVASWACCLTNPSDLGYDGADFDLPPLRIHEVITKTNVMENDEGQTLLFAETTQTLNERRSARRNSLADRVAEAAKIANASEEQCLIWCDLNAESEALSEAIEDCVEVKGADSVDYKEEAMEGFGNGKYKCLVSKSSIAGFGVNWQNCHRVVYVGLSDSFEMYYQSVRRCWRFGQTEPVDVYIIISDAESVVKDNIERKQNDAQNMTRELVRFTKEILAAEIHHTVRISESYFPSENMEVPSWIVSAA